MRVHGQDRKHDRNVVDNGRKQADHHVGGRMPQSVVHKRRYPGKIAELTQTSHAENHSVKEEQGIPLSLGDFAEQVEGCVPVAGYV